MIKELMTEKHTDMRNPFDSAAENVGPDERPGSGRLIGLMDALARDIADKGMTPAQFQEEAYAELQKIRQERGTERRT
jgi:hypothetical protein